ncbi:MAG TPA: TRAP transporter small permease [Vineibacter sp.]|nr:TRAP transporter small permease [Vineibacter sp.]
MQTPLKWFGSISRACAIVAGWALLAISVATCVEILGRKYFNFSFRGLDEIGGYMLGAVSAFGFAYALSRHSHMRVTLLFPYVPTSAQAFLNLLATISLAAMAVFCAWRGGIEALDVLVSGKRSNTPLSAPLWIPQTIWFVGMALFAAGAVLMAFHSVALLFRDRATLNRVYGPPSLEEEISTEIGHAIPGDSGASRT